MDVKNFTFMSAAATLGFLVAAVILYLGQDLPGIKQAREGVK
jgi:hypothetical protein